MSTIHRTHTSQPLQKKPSSFCYPYPHPAVTTDTVLFSLQQEKLCVLLIRRAAEPYRLSWALPGGFLDIDETPEACARRELAEETGIREVYLEQLFTFGDPTRDPRERVISIAYLALAPAIRLKPRAGSDARQASWYPFDALPDLAFDHADILRLAQQRLASKLVDSTIVFQLLPEYFDLNELHAVYEIILNTKVDKRRLGERFLANHLLEVAGGRPSRGDSKSTIRYRAVNPTQVIALKHCSIEDLS